jgi:hypothetical protein
VNWFAVSNGGVVPHGITVMKPVFPRGRRGVGGVEAWLVAGVAEYNG